MGPLVVHLASFTILYLIRLFAPNISILSFFSSRAEVVSIGLLFITTGIAHFTMVEPMAEMLPSFFPYKIQVVYISGAFEIILGLSLLVNGSYRSLIGVTLIIFLIMSLPINIYSALFNVGLGAKGSSYLYFRVPLQFFWGTWIWFFVVKDRTFKI